MLACYRCVEGPVVIVHRSSREAKPEGVGLAAVPGGSGEGQMTL